MLRNIFRPYFAVVFLLLSVAAGLFWLGELRGYRAELLLLALPRTEATRGAAENLSAIGNSLVFAVSVYDAAPALGDPFLGKLPAERKARWQKTVDIRPLEGSDVIVVEARGVDQDTAETLARTIATQLAASASRLYDVKTDLELRILEGPYVISSLSAWPRFALYTFGTGFAFTLLFFAVLSTLEALFPKRRGHVRPVEPQPAGEYVISADTFRPRRPASWSREAATPAAAPMPLVTREEEYEEVPSAEETFDDGAVSPMELERGDEPVPEEELSDESVSPAPLPEEIFEPTLDPLPNFQRSAAPDNLPIVEAPLSPLQGAQARLMKADIDATAAAQALESEVALGEESGPLTHEPTQEDYKRRLNELLSGRI
jgi:hypothetical protein